MNIHRSNNNRIRPGKAGRHGFSYLPGLLLAVLLAGLSLASGACTAGASTPATTGATTTVAESTTAMSTQTGATTATTAATTTTGSTGNEEPAEVQLIGADEALQILNDNEDAILLDVRTEQEFVTGHIAGAVLIPVDEIRARLAELPEDRNTPIIVYCRSGNRSATAARMLTEAGYRAVYDLGGINSWPYEIVR